MRTLTLILLLLSLPGFGDESHGTSSVTAVAPAEAAKPIAERGKNVELPEDQLDAPAPKVKFSRAKQAKRLGLLEVIRLGRRNLDMSYGVSGQENTVFKKMPEKFLVGPTGLGPCIGLILHWKDGTKDQIIHVFHFTAMDNPLATLEKLGPFPKEARAAIVGGDGGEESDYTLDQVVKYLEKHHLTIDGFAPYAGLFVDSKGDYFSHETEIKLGEPLP